MTFIAGRRDLFVLPLRSGFDLIIPFNVICCRVENSENHEMMDCDRTDCCIMSFVIGADGPWSPSIPQSRADSHSRVMAPKGYQPIILSWALDIIGQVYARASYSCYQHTPGGVPLRFRVCGESPGKAKKILVVSY